MRLRFGTAWDKPDGNHGNEIETTRNDVKPALEPVSFLPVPPFLKCPETTEVTKREIPYCTIGDTAKWESEVQMGRPQQAKVFW
jgi:hypothetical protein